MNEYGQTLEEAFDAFLTAYHGVRPWSHEERQLWIAQCEREGFDTNKAVQLYDQEWEDQRSFVLED